MVIIYSNFKKCCTSACCTRYLLIFFCGHIAKSKWLTTERVVFTKALQSVVKDRYNEAAQKKWEISWGRAGGKL